MIEFNILLVDDESRFLHTTMRLLARQGYSVMTAVNGSEALELMSCYQFQVVVLDVRIPGSDSLQVLKRMKQDFPLVEVIMLTGHATVDVAVECMRSGATDYLIKPADIDLVMRKVDEAIEKQNLQKRKLTAIQQV